MHSFLFVENHIFFLSAHFGRVIGRLWSEDLKLSFFIEQEVIVFFWPSPSVSVSAYVDLYFFLIQV